MGANQRDERMKALRVSLQGFDSYGRESLYQNSELMSIIDDQAGQRGGGSSAVNQTKRLLRPKGDAADVDRGESLLGGD
ncbi:hypothetical protein ColTof4_13967 [Colletotrichum tofieldiae]|nr:hypothetical protein ColTof3_14599 [Colletotrichum tofieldiae]GKT81544.1 hypothetical protein ColTof4_13967 [Colletotrichum tofieldiae]